MATTYSRDAIQFEADFAAHYFGLSPEEALTHEAVYFYQLQNKEPYSRSFDSGETGTWLHQYLPSDLAERQRIANEIKALKDRIHADEASFQHYCYEYAQFSKSHRPN